MVRSVYIESDRANARQPGKSLIFLACTADWTVLHDIRKTITDNCETPNKRTGDSQLSETDNE